MALSTAEDHQFLLAIGLVFIALGAVNCPLSTFFRNRLRYKIVNYLALIKA